MGWARVATVNENWAPLQQVDVECFDLDSREPIAVVRSDGGGVAFFDGLPDDRRWFFKPRTTRVSTAVGGRTYTGQVRLQILASHPGTNCFDYFVEPSGNFGTHKTIQAAIDAAMVTTGIKRILVMAGTYNENLVITGTGVPPYTLSTLFIEGCSPAQGAISPETPPGVPVNAASVVVNGGAAAALTYGTTSLGPHTLLIGIGLKADYVGKVVYLRRGYIHLIRSTVLQSNAAGTGLDTGGTSTQICDGIVLEHCVIDGGAFAIRATTMPRILNCQIRGPIDLAIGSYTNEGVYIANSSFDANNADYAVELQHLGSVDPFRFENNIVRQRNVGGGGLRCGGLTDSLEGIIILGNEFYGPGAGIAIRIGGADFFFATQALVVGNAIWEWATGVSIHASSTAVVLGNSYSNVTTPVSGTVTLTPSELGHNLLDGSLHPDTLAGSVLDGDTIIGNVTPKWSRLAISIPAANVRNVFGIDNAELRPSWKTALDGTAPADIAAAGSSGSSLVFSHRDHIHKHPVFASGDLHTEYLTSGEADLLYAPIGGGAHAILSATHSDTTAHAAVVGGLITGQAGPVWAYLAVGAAGSGLWTDGTDTTWTVSPRYAGYLRVGSASAPTNTTAGDLTAVRLSLGNGALAAGQVLYSYNPSVANASATNAFIQANFTPTANGAYDMRGLEVQARYYGAFNNTSNLYGGVFSVSVGGTGKVNYLTALVGFGLQLRTGAGAAMAVGDARATSFQLVYGSGRAAGETATIDALTGVRIDSGYSTLIAGDVVTNAYGVYIQNMGNAKVTNAYGIYIAGVSAAATLNVGIKLDGCTTAALWLNTDTPADGVVAWGTARDTNLYRSAANVLKTDDSLTVGIDFQHLGANIGFFGHAVAARDAAYAVANVTPNRAYDADLTSVDEISDVLGTLITYFISIGLLQ